MMKLAEFKRTIKPGDTLTMTGHSHFDLQNDKHKFLLAQRKVKAVHSSYLLIETVRQDGIRVNSRLDFPSADGFFIGRIGHSASEGVKAAFALRFTYIEDDSMTMDYIWEQS